MDGRFNKMSSGHVEQILEKQRGYAFLNPVPADTTSIFYPTTWGGATVLNSMVAEASTWCEAQFGPTGERWCVVSGSFCLRDESDATAFGDQFVPT